MKLSYRMPRDHIGREHSSENEQPLTFLCILENLRGPLETGHDGRGGNSRLTLDPFDRRGCLTNRDARNGVSNEIVTEGC